MKKEELKYGIKDGITGILRGKYAKMGTRYTVVSEPEITEMLQRIANRRKDPMFYFQSQYIDNEIDYRSTEMIG